MSRDEEVQAAREDVVAKVARDVLRVPTLKSRGSDAGDFYTLAVWSLRRALLVAYMHGRAEGLLEHEACGPEGDG